MLSQTFSTRDNRIKANPKHLFLEALLLFTVGFVCAELAPGPRPTATPPATQGRHAPSFPPKGENITFLPIEVTAHDPEQPTGNGSPKPLNSTIQLISREPELVP